MNHSPEFLALVNAAKTRIEETNIPTLQKRIAAGENLTVIDVREKEEFLAGHIPGATWIGKGILERDILKHFPDKSRELLLYCGGGFRSALAADALRQMGYDRPVSVDGGFRAWRESGAEIALLHETE